MYGIGWREVGLYWRREGEVRMIELEDVGLNWKKDDHVWKEEEKGD